ncbi:ABC transporter permease [Pontibacter populi]|uniref:FtsX-like permease family protein n=1 Tax=Pontibacter populi TaxID=890055 RepID=A0ABV1RY84_9BACT
MIRHLFKLIWNRKRSNFLMILEVFFSFLVLFGVCSLLISFYINYKKPVGIAYENIWVLNAQAHDIPELEKRQRLEQMVKRLDALDEVEYVAIGSENGPYTRNTWNSGLLYNNKEVIANMVYVQHDAFKDVMGLEMVEGRWFTENDASSNQEPIILTLDAKEQLFGDEPAVGKKVTMGHMPGDPIIEKKVVGVVEAYKPGGELESMGESYFLRTTLADTAQQSHSMIYIRVKPGTSPVFEQRILDQVSGAGPSWTLNLQMMPDLRTSYLKQSLSPVITLLIVCGFLILNVALGLFGVLWQSINKRYSEIGLRRALGATSGNVYKQFLGEILVVATFGLLLGCFFAVQFPLLGVFDFPAQIYTTAIIVSVLLIYALVILCAIYPSRQAAAIHPATALHEE